MLRTALVDSGALRISSRRLLQSSSVCSQLDVPAEKKKRISSKPKRPKPAAKGGKAAKNDWARDPNLVKEVLPEHPLLAGTRNRDSLLVPDPVTLEEVERFRPDFKATRLMLQHKEAYAESYKQVAKNLGRAFKKQQLLGALELYDIAIPKAASSPSKEHATTLILKKWGLKPVGELSKRRVSREISMKPGEAFVILNEFARPARQKGVVMSFSLDSSKLCLGAHSGEIIDEWLAQITQLRENSLDQKTTSLLFPTHISDPELQAISVATGAFLERLPDSRYCLTYNREYPNRYSFALQALNKIGYENSEDRPQDPAVAFNIPEDSQGSYSLQPFASAQSLFSQKAAPATFRLSPEGIPSASQGFEAALSALRPSLFESSSGTLSVDIMPGHVTFHCNTPDSLAASTSFKGGEQDIRSALPEERSFSQYIPQNALDLPSESSQTYQRLTYSGLRSPDLTFSDATPTLRLFVTSDTSLNGFLHQRYPHLKDATPSSETAHGGQSVFYGLCDKGWKRDIDVLVPDRSIDLHLHVSNNSSHAVPKVLQTYVDELNTSFKDSHEESDTPPMPPLTLWQGDQLYVLTASEVVRGGFKGASPSHKIVTEVARDGPSGDTKSSCYVNATLQDSEDSWNYFLEQSSWLAEFASNQAGGSIVDEYGDSSVAWP